MNPLAGGELGAPDDHLERSAPVCNALLRKAVQLCIHVAGLWEVGGDAHAKMHRLQPVCQLTLDGRTLDGLTLEGLARRGRGASQQPLDERGHHSRPAQVARINDDGHPVLGSRFEDGADHRGSAMHVCIDRPVTGAWHKSLRIHDKSAH